MKLLRSIPALVALFTLALPVLAAPSPFSGLTVTKIEMQDDLGNPLTKPGQIAQLIGVKTGDRFTESAVRKSISLLYLKGTFRDIRVDGVRDGNGVRLVYTFVPITVIDRVVISGRDALSRAAVASALPRLEGKELREDRLADIRAGLVELYQARGYFEASVTFRVERLPSPHRVILHIDINEGEPTVIADIDFVGNTVFRKKDLLAVMKSRIGRPLDRDLLLDTDLQAILQKYTDAGYPTAKPGPVTMSFRGHEAFVRILGTEGPRVTVRITGNRAIGTDTLKESLFIWSDHDVSEATIDSSADKIKSLYREKGYADVAVAVSRNESPGRLDLIFAVTEGPRVTVEKIDIEGNSVFSDGDIRRAMALREPGWFRRTPFREDQLEQDVDNLRDRYRDAGYLSASVKQEVTRSRDGREAFITISVREGLRTVTGSVTFEGNTVFTAADLLQKVSLKPGAPYSERIVDDDRYRILTAYSNKGYLYARVDADTVARNGSVDVRYRIAEDRVVRIGKIIVRGNERTKDYVIMRELLVKPGDPYDYGAILASQQQIYRLGYFSLAKFDPVHPGEKEYVKDMLLTVEERPAGVGEITVGYGDLDRLRGSVEVGYRNLWGTAEYTSLRFEESDILKRAIFNYQKPWFLNRRLDAKFSLVWSDAERLNSDTREIYYKTRKTTASFGVERSYRHFKPSLTYQFENVVNYDVLQAAQITPEDSGRVLVSSLSPALVWDLRDDVFNPHRGSLYGVVAKEALRELASQADFSKVSVQANWFLPVRSNVLALSVRAGMAWPFRNTNEIPLHERFYVGGGTTIRGFTQDSVGPSAVAANGETVPQGGSSMAVFNIEFRVNPGEGLGFVLFADGGNVWSGQELNVGNLRESYGAGLRYGTPIGPFRLDYGQKAHRRPGESPGEVHFNIGHTF